MLQQLPAPEAGRGRTTDGPRLELADVFRAHADVHAMSAADARVARAIMQCRTAALGGHKRSFTCGHAEISYNSCRNRHCPKCQGLTQAKWLEDRQRDLLPVPYFHVVFTIPRQLHAFFRVDPKTAYRLLFTAVADTLKAVGLQHRGLGAEIGCIAVLHTWTQQLGFHPHIHCVVPGGGFNAARDRWIPVRKASYLAPEKKLKKVFRGKLLSSIERSLKQGELWWPPGARDNPFGLLRRAALPDWVVYAKAPFAGPKQVLAYLSRYTHRVAISNYRLVELSEGRVTFRYKDRQNGDAQRLMTLPADEFIRRFMLHRLPKGFVRIRHYGFLANGCKRDRIALARKLLGVTEPTPELAEPDVSWEERLRQATGVEVRRCSRCGEGRLFAVDRIRPLLRADLRERSPP
jgi:hypothetical protein